MKRSVKLVNINDNRHVLVMPRQLELGLVFDDFSWGGGDIKVGLFIPSILLQFVQLKH